MQEQQYILEMQNIRKVFPGVVALDGVELKVRPGEIHGLMGENGAGKSTLVKCLAGVYSPTAGEIVYRGEKLGRYTTRDALNMGISMIHQELSPVVDRPIMENIWLGREPRNRLGLINHRKMYEESKAILAQIEVYDDPATLMKDLTVARMQMVEIAKAISYDSNIIVMDEPTSALTNKEIRQLFKIMRKLKDEGKSIIYISHKLDEVYEITDRITVYRDGKYVGCEATSELPEARMINMMVGRDVTELFPKTPCEIGEVKLEVRNLSHHRFFDDVSFTVRKGEILGFAGLIGAGRTEVIQTIFGIYKKTGGEVLVDGEPVTIKNSEDAIANGMALLTEDRRSSGIIPVLSVGINMVIASVPRFLNKIGLIKKHKMNNICKEFVEKIRVKTPHLEEKIMNLSGGNQQKALVARWLMTDPEILFVDEPTRGIDVGTKAEIHRLISMLAQQGKAVVMVSSELPEVMGMSDRIVVMYKGKVTGVLENSSDLTQDEIMMYATNTMKKETA